MNYISTRNAKVSVSASESIVKGISVDGGLFVPSSTEIPLTILSLALTETLEFLVLI